MAIYIYIQFYLSFFVDNFRLKVRDLFITWYINPIPRTP